MKRASIILAVLFAFGSFACSESDDGSKDTVPGNDLVGNDANLDTTPVDLTGDSADAAGDTLPDTDEDTLAPVDTLDQDLLDPVDTFQPVDTVQVDTVLGPASSCRQEAGEFTSSCEYYWDSNPNVGSKQDLCESTQRTWSVGNICETDALGYCEDPAELTTFYCYPADGMTDADKIEFCKMGCPLDSFVTL